MSKKTKVFGIGLSKTATTSLSAALEMLDYRTKHFPIRMIKYESGELDIKPRYAKKYDAMTDIPIARFYQKLYHHFPDAKFILTLRDMDGWLDSCRRHFWPGQILKGNNWINKLHKEVYNAIDFDKSEYKKAYRTHKNEVFDFFEDKKDQLLVIDITDGDGWKPVCKFLNEPIPSEDFPKKDCLYTEIFKIFNIQNYRNKDIELTI